MDSWGCSAKLPSESNYPARNFDIARFLLIQPEFTLLSLLICANYALFWAQAAIFLQLKVIYTPAYSAHPTLRLRKI